MGLLNLRNAFTATCISGFAAIAHADDASRTYTITPQDTNYIITARGDDYNIRVQGNTITLNGSINADAIEKTKDFLTRLSTNSATREINLVLDSTGGYVNAGYNLVDHINAMDIPVHIQCNSVGSMAFMLCINDAFASARGNENSKGMFHFSFIQHSFSQDDIHLGAPENGWKIELEDYQTLLQELNSQQQENIALPIPDTTITFRLEDANNALERLEQSGDSHIVIEFDSDDCNDGKSRRIFMTRETLQSHIHTMQNNSVNSVDINISGISIHFSRERLERRIQNVEEIHERFAREFAAASILTQEDVASLRGDIRLSGIQMQAIGLFDSYGGPASEQDIRFALDEFCEDQPQLSICAQ